MSFRVKSIPTRITAEVRETLVSPQYKSLQAAVSLATGYGPCRSCLRVFDQGNENRLFFTYNAFDGRSDLPDPGPVFIHHEECRPFSGPGVPEDLLSLPVFLEAFGDNSSLLSRQRLHATDAERQIATLFRDENVRFINMRNAEAGCFIATIDRV